MNTERIRELAKQTDLDWHKHWNDDESNKLEKFAGLIAAEEREACAKVYEPHISPFIVKAIRARGNE